MGKSPQVEDGFTRVANELFDAVLRFGFTANQLSIVMAITRKTYGYNKKEDDMSASQIGELCGIMRQHVTTTLNDLFEMGVITKRPGVYGSVIGIQKDYKKWSKLVKNPVNKTSPKSGQVSDIRTSPEIGQGVQDLLNDSPKSGQVDSPKSGHTIDNLPKETKQKKTRAREKTITLSDFLAECEKNGELPIPMDDPVFKYADEIKLPGEFLRLGWLEFKNQKMLDGAKPQKDWRQTFRVYVRKNWLGIWRIDRKTGGYILTDAGVQAQLLHKEAA